MEELKKRQVIKVFLGILIILFLLLWTVYITNAETYTFEDNQKAGTAGSGTSGAAPTPGSTGNSGSPTFSFEEKVNSWSWISSWWPSWLTIKFNWFDAFCAKMPHQSGITTVSNKILSFLTGGLADWIFNIIFAALVGFGICCCSLLFNFVYGFLFKDKTSFMARLTKGLTIPHRIAIKFIPSGIIVSILVLVLYLLTSWLDTPVLSFIVGAPLAVFVFMKTLAHGGAATSGRGSSKTILKSLKGSRRRLIFWVASIIAGLLVFTFAMSFGAKIFIWPMHCTGVALGWQVGFTSVWGWLLFGAAWLVPSISQKLESEDDSEDPEDTREEAARDKAARALADESVTDATLGLDVLKGIGKKIRTGK